MKIKRELYKVERAYAKAAARQLLRKTKDAAWLLGEEKFITVRLKIGQIRRLAKYILVTE